MDVIKTLLLTFQSNILKDSWLEVVLDVVVEEVVVVVVVVVDMIVLVVVVSLITQCPFKQSQLKSWQKSSIISQSS